MFTRASVIEAAASADGEEKFVANESQALNVDKEAFELAEKEVTRLVEQAVNIAARIEEVAKNKGKG